MRFLFKLMFLGFVGLLILPSIYPDATGEDETYQVGERVGAMQLAVSAATFTAGVAQDVKGLCERDSQVCAHGSVLVDMAVERARHGARIAMSLVSPAPDADADPQPADPIATGSVQP